MAAEVTSTFFVKSRSVFIYFQQLNLPIFSLNTFRFLKFVFIECELIEFYRVSFHSMSCSTRFERFKENSDSRVNVGIKFPYKWIVLYCLMGLDRPLQ